MPELRWTLLILGVIFIAVLAWWERRKPHQAARLPPRISGESRPPPRDDPSWGPEIEPGEMRVGSQSRAAGDVRAAGEPGARSMREPALVLPEIRAFPDFRTHETAHAPGIAAELPGATREPVVGREIPVVEIPELHSSEPEWRIPSVGEADPREPDFKDSDVSLEHSQIEHWESSEPDFRDAEIDELQSTHQEASAAPDFPDFELPSSATSRADPVPERGSRQNPAPAPPVLPAAPSPGTPAAPPPGTSAAPLPGSPPKPIVGWPPEEERKLLGLRVVARPSERFPGRLVRQALSAEGFVLGEFDIFHKPDANNRAVLSAASLTKPGSFDLETMDTQRFSGLNLFAVLPGPKSPQKTFDELLLTARMLNERLEGALQDDRGGPLTPMRIQAIREALGGEAKS